MKDHESVDRKCLMILCLTTILWLSGIDALSQGIRGGIPSRQLQEENLEAFIDLKFSLWHPGLRAVDVKDPRSELFSNVISALDNFLCEEADMVVTNSSPTRCTSMNLNFSDLSLLEHQNSTVEDASEGEIEWTEWVITYAIIQVGSKFFDQAEIMDEAITVLVMEYVAQLALDVNILEGAMDRLVGVRWSPSDQENAKFQPFLQKYDSSSTNEDNQASDSYESPAHLLRIIGILMFGVNLCATLCLRRLGRLRREQRESEAEKKKEELGGLVTEEGLDRILDIGKRETMVLFDESQELAASHGAGDSCTKLLLQDEVCVLPEAYNLQTRTRSTLSLNPSNGGQLDVELEIESSE